MAITLSASVGVNGVNKSDDVKKVQERLIELGFGFFGAATGQLDEKGKLVHAIHLFQSIKDGKQTFSGDGRVDPNGGTLKWLNATNAPRWKKLTASGTGFVNVEAGETTDYHDWGTKWLDDTLIAAGQAFQNSYLATHTSSLLTINDASWPEGASTPDHGGHETGLSCDIRLPQKGVTGAAAGNRTVNSPDYDQDATRALLKALRAQPLADHGAIYLQDKVLITEGLCIDEKDHLDHIHFQIKPPARED